MLRKSLLSVFVILVAVGLMWSPAQAQEELIVAQSATRTTLDPHGENDTYTSQVRAQIYDTLINQDEDMQIQPGLAEDWEQIDQTTWEFELREGVYFHNGEELTASDVKYTFDRMLCDDDPAVAAFILAMVEETEVIDNYTVRLHLEEPFVPILSHLSHPVTGILNETATEEAGEDYGTLVAVGTGPYEFEEWATGDYIVLEANEDYWGEGPEIERVRFRAVPEDTVRAIEVETGEAHISYEIAPIDVARLDEDPGVYLVNYPTLSTDYIGFNCEREPFDEVKVRQAINYAIDIDPIVEHVYEGQAAKAMGPISDMVWGAHPELEPYGYDVEKAQELLAEAGYEDGFEATLYTDDNPMRIDIAEIVQDNLRHVNIDLEVEVLDWGDHLDRTGTGEHDMFILGWSTVTADADYGLYALFHSEQHGHDGNRTFYTNPEVDERLEHGRRLEDEEMRMDTYHGAQELIYEDAPWVFIAHEEEYHGVRDNVRGFTPHPAGHHDLSGVYFEE